MQHDEKTNSFRIVVVTPLMRRCHQLQSSWKMVQNFLPCIACEREFVKVFIDSCTDFVAHETVFMGIVMCGTPGGAVPLGMYLTNEMSIFFIYYYFLYIFLVLRSCFSLRNPAAI